MLEAERERAFIEEYLALDLVCFLVPSVLGDERNWYGRKCGGVVEFTLTLGSWGEGGWGREAESLVVSENLSLDFLDGTRLMELGDVLSILFLPLRFPRPLWGEVSGGFLRKEAMVSWLGDLGIVPE